MSELTTAPPSAGRPPLSWPDYEISFVDAVKRGYTKYVEFNGRASRAEFWYLYLFVVGLTLILVLPSAAIGSALAQQNGGQLGPLPIVGLSLAGLVYFGSLLPMLSAAVRRLHDAGYTGLFLLLGLITGLIPLIMCALPTSPNAVRYGPPGYPEQLGYPGQPPLYGGAPNAYGAPSVSGPTPYGAPPPPYGAAPGYPHGQTPGYPQQTAPYGSQAPQGYGGQAPQGYGGQPSYPSQAGPQSQPPEQPRQG